MSASSTSARVAELRQALDAIGDALRVGDAGTLAACEGRLTAALAGVLQIDPPRAKETGDDVRRELTRARAALDRCRRLGRAVEDFTSAILTAAGLCTGYDRAGRSDASNRPVGRLHARV